MNSNVSSTGNPPINESGSRPLAGRAIVTTRAADPLDALCQTLEALGASVLHCPTIMIVPPENPSAILEALHQIKNYHWVIFTSANGVIQTLKILQDNNLEVSALSGCKIAAVGPATAQYLQNVGLTVNLVPTEYTAAGLFHAFQTTGEPLSGQRFLLLRADIAREDLPRALKSAGALVDEVIAYRTLEPPVGPETTDLIERLTAKSVDAILFASASAVIHFARRMAEPLGKNPQLLDGVALTAIGPVTGEALKEHLGRVDLEAPVHTIPGLAEALQNHFQTR
jgi:uroporphyrinogen-III synthase